MNSSRYLLPQLYDALYAYKDYEGEAARIVEIVDARFAGAASLLDVACGTGKHLEILRGTYRVEGADIDRGLLEIARDRVPDVPLHLADMRDLGLQGRFDVITCLFSAIGHLKDTDELDAAIASMAAHLTPRGILLVEPWIEPDRWLAGAPALLTVDEPELKIARITVTGRREQLSTLAFHYLVATPAGVERHEEHMELGLFTQAEMLAAFERARLHVEHDPEGLIGRGLYIGLRAADG